MKRFFIIYSILILSGNTLNLDAQITIFPEVDKSSGVHNVKIIKVELTRSYTILDLYFVSRQEGSWLCVDKNFYITPSGFEDRKYLIMAKGIDLCPKMTKVNQNNYELRFQLYFPPLGKNILKIDAIESKSRLNFNGIHINNNGGIPLDSSNDSIDAVNFTREVLQQNTSMDSIAGIWIRKIKKSHYGDQNLLVGEHTDIPDTIFISLQKNIYKIYSLDGHALRETITKLTGNLGYFYEKQLPEVNASSSGYIVFYGSNRFKVSFILPVRLAKYELLGEYIDSDKLIEQQEYTKLSSEEMIKLLTKMTGKNNH